jgi:HEAT repeat protein
MCFLPSFLGGSLTCDQPPFKEKKDMNANRSERHLQSPVPSSAGIFRLIDTLRNGVDEMTRISAISALAESRNSRAVVPLIICCRDNSLSVRMAAVEALSNLRNFRAEPALREIILDKDEDVAIRQKAAIALAGLKGSSPREGLALLSRDTREHPAVRALAAWMLTRPG